MARGRIYPRTEAGSCKVLFQSLSRRPELMASACGIPPIKEVRSEVALKRCRCDLVIWHTDGSVTIIEVKGGSDARSIVAGIGQLHLQRIHFLMKYGACHVRMVLAVAANKVPRDIMVACASADVDSWAIGAIDMHEEIAQRIIYGNAENADTQTAAA